MERVGFNSSVHQIYEQSMTLKSWLSHGFNFYPVHSFILRKYGIKTSLIFGQFRTESLILDSKMLRDCIYSSMRGHIETLRFLL